MAARGEFFRSYHFHSQSEEVNGRDESHAENRPVPVQEAEIRSPKVSLVGHFD